MQPRLTVRDYFWPIAASGAVAIAVLVLSMIGFAQQADQAAKTREEAVITAGVSSRVGEVARQVVPQAIWDDAVANLDNAFDLSWASDNIGVFFSQTLEFDYAGVVNADDQPIYAMLGGADVSGDAGAPFVEAAVALLQSVRRDEAERGSQTGLAEPISAAAIHEIGGRFYILSATLVQPDFGNARVVHERSPII